MDLEMCKLVLLGEAVITLFSLEASLLFNTLSELFVFYFASAGVLDVQILTSLGYTHAYLLSTTGLKQQFVKIVSNLDWLYLSLGSAEVD